MLEAKAPRQVAVLAACQVPFAIVSRRVARVAQRGGHRSFSAVEVHAAALLAQKVVHASSVRRAARQQRGP